MTRSRSAERKRRYRQRQRRGLRAYSVIVPDELIEVAINAGHLSEADSHDRDKVSEMLGRVAAEWGNLWRDYFGTRPAS